MSELVVRPMIHTDRTEEWVSLLRTLGLRVLVSSPGWTELAGTAGRVALHDLFQGVSEGQVALGFETSDLAAFAEEVNARAPEGLTVELVDEAHGAAVRVTGRDGLVFLVDQLLEETPSAESSPESSAESRPESTVVPGPVVVRQLWVSNDVERAAGDLEALGLHRRLTELNGRTVDLDADGGGRVLVHLADEGEVGAVFAIDCDGDLERAHAALLAAGVRHDVIDETHGRTLKVPMPGVDQLLWVAHEDEEPVGAVRH